MTTNRRNTYANTSNQPTDNDTEGNTATFNKDPAVVWLNVAGNGLAFNYSKQYKNNKGPATSLDILIDDLVNKEVTDPGEVLFSLLDIYDENPDLFRIGVPGESKILEQGKLDMKSVKSRYQQYLASKK